MYKIRRITESNHISKDIDLVRDFLSDLSSEYPLHDYWFDEVAKRIKNKSREREILFVLNDEGVVMNNSKPIITVSENKREEFLPLFQAFGFIQTEPYENKYKDNTREYCFNGYLSPETILTKDRLQNQITETELKKTA